MIEKLSIRNFKSIRQFDLDCRRVNVFIGEPNAGKTNILEGLGLWCPGIHHELRSVCRANYVAELFFDQNSAPDIEIELDGVRLGLVKTEQGALLGILDDSLDGMIDPFHLEENLDAKSLSFHQESHGPVVKYYLYNPEAVLDEGTGGSLSAPFGRNLPSLLASNKAARQTASDYFSSSRYRLTIDIGKKQLLMSREEDAAVVSFPYSAMSETLRRMVFYHLALQSNHHSVLAFDEPEAHSYPPYTKTLAETIAQDERGNQFFLTTHSPYLLTSLIAKTPVKDLNVVLCRMENFETKGYVMDDDQKQQLMEWDMSAFFNFDRLLPEIE